MNSQHARFIRPVLGTLCIVSLAALSGCRGDACFGFDGCFDDGGVQTVTLSGTAATGPALASATVNVDCARGSVATLSDGGGHYSVTFDAALPCAITVTSGGTSLHSLAYAGGTFNTTPQTELLLVYLAAQLGTSPARLIGDLPNSSRLQQALENQTNVQAAQTAVVANLQQRYAVMFAVPEFLTTPFFVGQPGVDGDLGVLANAGAIDANGMPDALAVSLLQQAGPRIHCEGRASRHCDDPRRLDRRAHRTEPGGRRAVSGGAAIVRRAVRRRTSLAARARCFSRAKRPMLPRHVMPPRQRHDVPSDRRSAAAIPYSQRRVGRVRGIGIDGDR